MCGIGADRIYHTVTRTFTPRRRNERPYTYINLGRMNTTRHSGLFLIPMFYKNDFILTEAASETVAVRIFDS
ncbi:hypothetical protein AG1IA_06243 [Rhizoctonia solani AG-1 IA]|uniref:Uncharacterized protein n=1 Tax=Thanatephorus cucumeris (strain AG1-IA) TaxID=983506 RepID=L8WNI8_THACA|nr:hypothetical protein AG1IA_06243 [Rhizoctonia solani AG-1 IA]